MFHFFSQKLTTVAVTLRPESEYYLTCFAPRIHVRSYACAKLGGLHARGDEAGVRRLINIYEFHLVSKGAL